MKKIFIVFIISVIVATVLILPCSASMTDSFGSYTNLFDPYDIVQSRFYTDLDNYQDNNFYSVDLVGGQSYTFISTQGSRAFYVGQSVFDSHGYSSCYSFDSYNLLDPSLLVSGTTFVNNYNGTYTLVKTSNNRFSNTAYLGLPSDSYIFSLNFIEYTVPYIWVLVNGSFYDVVSVDKPYFIYNGAIDSLTLSFDASLPDGTATITMNLFLSESSNTEYLPLYADPTFNNDLTYVYTFDCKKSGTYLVGINDVLAGSTTNQFSYNQSSENEFYLVQGSLTPDQIADVLQQDRYNQGYTQGYKEGEYDGMNSTSIFKSVILTVLSGPFVVVSNALNFEIFGINIYTFIQIILTILIVAFLITRLKGRE